MSGILFQKNILKEIIKDEKRKDEFGANKINKKHKIKHKNRVQIRTKILKKILILIIYYLFIIIFSNNEPLLIKSANITLLIKGIGEKNIISGEFNKSKYPNEIFINGKKQPSIKSSYQFNQTNNIIELFWNHNNIECSYMFKECYDLNEIDLSNFNSSNCKYMYGMFERCLSLTSINLANFDTSHAIEINSMFDHCTSLKSLNLSNFNTSQ